MKDGSQAPRIESAPGLIWRPTARGWRAMWQARSDLAARGFHPKSTTLLIVAGELSDFDRQFITDRCNALQAAMLTWGRGGVPEMPPAMEGTIAALIRAYQHDPYSTYRKVRYHSRTNYDSLLRRIEKDHGQVHLEHITARLLYDWHEAWTELGLPMAHALMAMLRNVCKFGLLLGERDAQIECTRIKVLLSEMRFPNAPARTQALTAEQANAIRAAAHSLGLKMIALAQAFAFECTLRQRDVIGEWVPASEPGVSDVTWRRIKWLRGLRWNEIDANLVLRHVTSKKNKAIEVDLRLAPMVMEELKRLGELPASGPVIINPVTGRPYEASYFRKDWRKVARAAGIPDTVYNMDSRAGAISEATDAGAALEDVRHAATHSDIATTQRYSRNAAEKTAKVMTLRVEKRKQND